MNFKTIVCLTAVALVVGDVVMLYGRQQPVAPNDPAAPAPQAAPGVPAMGRGQGGRASSPPETHGLGNVAAGPVLEPSYDTVPPDLPVSLKNGGVLIFSKTNGYRVEPAMMSSVSALSVIAKLRGLPYFVTENGAVMNREQLSRFKLVIWNNTSGDTLNDGQKAAFKEWLEKGGTYFGIHGAGGDPPPRNQTPAGLIRSASAWKWLVTDVLGVQFIGHPRHQFADLHIEDSKSPITKGLPRVWHRTDEWYAFAENPRSKPGYHVLATVDEKSYDPAGFSMGADHPSIWWHCVGSGRALFSAIGHGMEMYQEPLMIQLLDNAVSWGVSQSGRACSN